MSLGSNFWALSGKHMDVSACTCNAQAPKSIRWWKGAREPAFVRSSFHKLSWKKKSSEKSWRSYGHPQACPVNAPSPGAQRTANSARLSKHGAQEKITTQLPAELVYVRIDTTKFKELWLISGNGRRQLAIGVRLASCYPIQLDGPESPGVRKGSRTGPTGFENQSPASFFLDTVWLSASTWKVNLNGRHTGQSAENCKLTSSLCWLNV